MGVHVHRAVRTSTLAEGLAVLLAVPPDDPFAQEMVVVPARGVERWLTQRLSHRLGVGAGGSDGICAGVDFLTPNSLVTLLLGTDRDDPWLPDQLAWPLLATIEACHDRPWARQLTRHLGLDPHDADADAVRQWRRGRRYAVARRLAGLFHGYAVQRPTLLRAWEEASPGEADGDGLGGALPPDLAWQAHLWRALLVRMERPSPVARHAETVRRLRDADPGIVLPPRISLFGHTRLARSEVELLGSLGTRREVHLWLPHPSPALWAALAAGAAEGPIPRIDDPGVLLVANPLLASLGRDVRELQRTLAPIVTDEDVDGAAGCRSGEDTPVGVGATRSRSWLGHLQADLVADRNPDAAQARARGIDPDEKSIQVHGCHGPTRQVEVLREVLLGLLADDPTLEPRDIVVMCPEIETFAPLVHATFGLGDIGFGGPVHPGHELRVQLADRSPTATNPLLALAARLVELAGGRFTASDVLDLADRPPVRRRFGFADDDLDQLRRWVDQAAIRWGLDEVHRRNYALADLSVNTWRWGLDRLLLGVTRAGAPDHISAGVLALDDVDSATIDLAGRVCEFVDRLGAFHDASQGGRRAEDWTAALREAVLGLSDVAIDDLWQRAELERELVALGDSGGGQSLTLSDLRVLMRDKVVARPTRANFRTGSLTVCSLVPMRSVPHRVVALLGLDDGVFPRGTILDGDDVLARTPVTGERDGRSEDRQLLLDAILAAEDTLVLTYTAADPQTGAPRPPAAPLGELIDAARRAAGIDADDAADARFRPPVRHHPLQTFDPRALAAEAATPSFDPHALEAAAAFALPRPTHPVTSLIAAPLPAREPADLTLADLLDFYRSPARAFLRTRLDVGDPLEADDPSDEIPIDVRGLPEWAVGDRLMHERFAGRGIDDVQRTERRRGQLPPGDLGNAVLVEVGPRADAVAQRSLALTGSAGGPRTGGPDPGAAVDVTVDLDRGRLLTGSIPGVRDRVLVLPTYSRLGAVQRLRAWIFLLALSAGTPASAGPWRVHAVGRARSDSAPEPVVVAGYGPLEADLARQFLADLVRLYDLGMTAPLPFAPKSSNAFAATLYQRRVKREDLPLQQARREWESGRYDGENATASVRRLYGDRPPLEALLGPAGEAERWAGPGEYAGVLTSGFAHVAMRVWVPAFIAEITQ